jgi:hypothetical protein
MRIMAVNRESGITGEETADLFPGAFCGFKFEWTERRVLRRPFFFWGCSRRTFEMVG